MFSDRAKIFVAAGRGGNGAASFRRETHVPRGGPDGGDGGPGGSVVIVADPQLRDLRYFARKVHFKAPAGRAGQGSRKDGATGKTLEIKVPLGTQVWEDDRLLGDLIQPGQRVVVAQGGAGGRGNARFVTSTRQAPKFAELGEEGEERWVTLTLKLMADVGLAGLPNAGKSSLLRRISNAKPKVADYPFTTLEPQLGVVDIPALDTSFTAADVPGLLEGASEGVGLGHQFLAHLERCHLILHLVDVTGYYSSDPLRNFRTILEELEAHTPELGRKPQILALSKIDVVEEERLRTLKADFARELESLRRRGHPAFSWSIDGDYPPVSQLVWPISAVTGAGLDALLRFLGTVLQHMGDRGQPGWTESVPEEAAQGPAGRYDSQSEDHAVYRPQGRAAESFSIDRDDEMWVVTGPAVRRLVHRFDLTDDEAVRYVAERLEKTGVYSALRERGAQAGDEVDIEGYIFVFD